MNGVALATVLAALVACTHPSTGTLAVPDESCTAIAADIELLRARFPSLVEYLTAAHRSWRLYDPNRSTRSPHLADAVIEVLHHHGMRG